MEISDMGNITDLKSHIDRPLNRRLRESYMVDLITILQAANDGRLKPNAAFELMPELVRKIKLLRDGGRIEQVLQKANMVILDKVFNDVDRYDQDGDNVVDLASEDL